MAKILLWVSILIILIITFMGLALYVGGGRDLATEIAKTVIEEKSEYQKLNDSNEPSLNTHIVYAGFYTFLLIIILPLFVYVSKLLSLKFGRDK